MPKRRSLVGTAREAMGDAPAGIPATPASAARAKEGPASRRRAALTAEKEAAHEALAAAAPEAAKPERGRAATPGPANAYEAVMDFASAALRQNLETGARLARCKSPMEVLAAQTAHTAALTQSFIAASLKLMQLSLSSGSWIRRG